MNILTTTTLRNNLKDALKAVSKKKDYLLITRKGRISSVIVNIDLFEDLLACADKKYLKSIKDARKEYQKGGYFTHDQVFGNI